MAKYFNFDKIDKEEQAQQEAIKILCDTITHLKGYGKKPDSTNKRAYDIIRDALCIPSGDTSL